MGRRRWTRWGLEHRNAKFLSEVTEDLYITTNVNLIFAEKYQGNWHGTALILFDYFTLG